MDPSFVFLRDLAFILLSASLGGLIFRRLGLSAVPGYILAGLIIGTPEISVPYVSDEQRIATIAQLGVVFLMFSIGLQFNLQRIHELGWRILFSTTIIALIIMSAVRFSADFLSLSVPAGIALAGIFMNSSSAIISKLIQEGGCSHERHGQLALGTTLLEDIVAVVLMAILGSYIAIEGSGSGRNPLLVIGLVTGFALIVFIVGTLTVPYLLRLRGIVANSEAVSVLIAGLALGCALLSVLAGFSLALGAFLSGVVVAGLRQKQVIERSFQGLKDIFLTVFFVTIGMMVDVRIFPEVLPWIALGTLGALFGRSLAAWFALMLVGEHPRTALQAALLLTPLGEFSFIIAGVAISGGLLPGHFQVIAVGVVLSTSLITPITASRSAVLSRFLAQGKIPALDQLHATYSRLWIGSVTRTAERPLWKLLRKRVIQISVEMLLVSTTLIFAGDLISAARDWVPGDLTYQQTVILLWSLVGLVCLIPLIAIWRNLTACAMIISESLSREHGLNKAFQSLLNNAIRVLAFVLLAIWLWNVLPGWVPRGYVLLLTFVLFAPAVLVSWRRAVKLHSGIEWMLDQRLSASKRNSNRHLFDSWKDQDWDLNLREFALPEDSPYGGRSLRQLALRATTGCSVVGIQRHSYSILNIGPETTVFPGDELLLLGSNEQIKIAIRFLSNNDPNAKPATPLSERILKSLRIEANHEVIGSSLSQLDWSKRYGVQVLAILREGKTLAGPNADTLVQKNDLLLLLGTAKQIDHLAEEVV